MTQTSLDFSSFKEAIQQEFLQLTKSFVPKVYICYPPELEFFVHRILGCEKIAGPSGSQTYKFVEYSSTFNKQIDSSGTIVFVTIPDPEFVSKVLEYFNNVKNMAKVIFTIPKSNAIITQILSNFGFSQVDNYPKNKEKEVFVQEFHADFLFIENSYFLLPCYHSFTKIFIDQDPGDIFASARALSKIQSIFGQIPQVITIGENAEKCNEIINGILNQSSFAKSCFPQIDTLLIVDRAADLITPFIFSGTGEQLLDNTFGIRYGRFLPNLQTDVSQSNEAFAEIRALSIADTMIETGSFTDKIKQAQEAAKNGIQGSSFRNDYLKYYRISTLKPKYEEIINLIEKCQNSINSNPTFMPCFNAEFTVIQGMQVNLLEEHLISMFNDWEDALRLICMESAACVNHSQKFVQSVQREILAEFGSQALPSILNLEKIGLLSSSKFYYEWNKLRNNMELLAFKDDNKGFKDWIFNPLNGYCPLTVRLASNAKEENVEPSQYLTSPQVRMTVTGKKPPFVEGSTRRILVFVIGGVTLSEAGIIRDIGLRSEGKYEFIIGSTDQINGKQFIHQICPFLDSQNPLEN